MATAAPLPPPPAGAASEPSAAASSGSAVAEKPSWAARWASDDAKDSQVPPLEP